MEYAAIIDSYPVVPEDIAGTLVPTLQRRRHVDLSVLSPGVDNRSYVERPRDLRVCVACKVQTLKNKIQNAHASVFLTPKRIRVVGFTIKLTCVGVRLLCVYCF